MAETFGAIQADADQWRIARLADREAGGQRAVLFLAEVPVNAAKRTVTKPDNEDALCEEAKRLAAELLPMAMTGHAREEGEDIMRFSCHAVPQPSQDLLEHKADAEKDGVRLWLLGSNVE